MIKRTLLALTVTALLATPALATHCPQDAAAIDHYIANATVSDDVKKEVVALKEKGLDEHKAGKHQDSEKLLAEAMRKLLMSAKK